MWKSLSRSNAVPGAGFARDRIRAVPVLVAWLLFAAPAVAAIGELDRRFGDGGSVLVPGYSGQSVLEMPDGRLLVVRTSAATDGTSRLAVHRYLANGTPDPSFGTGGRTLATLPGLDSVTVHAAALQPDGRIVVAGSFWRSGHSPYVARLDTQGALDTGYATGGVWVGGGTEPLYTSLLVTSQGEALAAISDWTSDRIDRFGPDGRYLGNLSWAIAPDRLAQQGDGRLIVSGYHRSLRAMVVTRLDLQGHVDVTFGSGGFAVLPRGTRVQYSSNLSIEPGGDRILLCGPGIARLTADGQLDTTFGVRGSGYVEFGTDGLPALDFCSGVLALRGGGVAYVGIRRAARSDGFDSVYVGGLTSAGLVDRRFGSGSGATEIDLGLVREDDAGWVWFQSAFVGTRSGDALLTQVTHGPSPGLRLARVDLGSGAALPDAPPPGPPAPPPAPTPPSPPPAPPTSDPPPVAPAPSPEPEAPASRGGGGALGALEAALLLLGALVVSRRRRR